MHSKLKKAAETEALKDAGEGLKAIAPRLDEIEAKLDRVLAVLQQARPAPPLSQQQRGGR